MFTSYSDELNRELLEDFFYDFNDAYARCEQTLLALELTPGDQSLLNELFRAVHTIKGNLGYVGLKEFCPILQGVEDILEELRCGRMAYDDLISDVVLLAIDATRTMVDDSINQRQPGIGRDTFNAICAAIQAVISAPAARRQRAIYDAIVLLAPDAASRKNPLAPGSGADDTAAPLLELVEFGVEVSPDLDFFAQLSTAFEQRSVYWHGRNRRIARLALAMNDAAGRPVNASQLAAAIYVHDLGMAFLSLDLLHKQSRYDNHEHQQLHRHVNIGCDMLRQMEHWQAASEMVLQHHEHCDGNGYPAGLTEMQICDGAKIIAIADAFEACSHSRAHHPELKRPLIRAVLEVNRYAGAQFSQFWVDIFNKVVRGQQTMH